MFQCFFIAVEFLDFGWAESDTGPGFSMGIKSETIANERSGEERDDTVPLFLCLGARHSRL